MNVGKRITLEYTRWAEIERECDEDEQSKVMEKRWEKSETKWLKWLYFIISKKWEATCHLAIILKI